MLQPVVATMIQQQSSVTLFSFGEPDMSLVVHAVVATIIQQQLELAADLLLLPDLAEYSAVLQPVVARIIQQQSLD